MPPSDAQSINSSVVDGPVDAGASPVKPGNFRLGKSRVVKHDASQDRKTVGFFEQFRFADATDKVLLSFGSLAAIATGALMVRSAWLYKATLLSLLLVRLSPRRDSWLVNCVLQPGLSLLFGKLLDSFSDKETLLNEATQFAYDFCYIGLAALILGLSTLCLLVSDRYSS